MAKRNRSREAKEQVELTVTREDAKTRIQERIEAGHTLKERENRSAEDLDKNRKEYQKWSAFNEELLKRIFTTDEMADEYSRRAPAGVVSMGAPSLDEKVRDLMEDIDDKIHRLESIVERLELIPVSTGAENDEEKGGEGGAKDSKEVFVVHGHDAEAKLAVARFLERVGLEPIILHEQANASKTIIEKIESYSNVGFGVVIYTPCDVGAKASESEEINGRPRQNVVFEHGFLIGKLQRQNVCALVKGQVETPNDIAGVAYTTMDQGDWQLELARELKRAGYPIDMNNVV
jgi:predicted nucleotide-binding protein